MHQLGSVTPFVVRRHPCCLLSDAAVDADRERETQFPVGKLAVILGPSDNICPVRFAERPSTTATRVGTTSVSLCRHCPPVSPPL